MMLVVLYPNTGKEGALWSEGILSLFITTPGGTQCALFSLCFFFYDFIDDDENILISSPFTVFLCFSLPILSTFVSM